MFLVKSNAGFCPPIKWRENHRDEKPRGVQLSDSYLGSCQNYGPLLGTPNVRCRIIIRTQKGTIILTTTHLGTYSPEV